MLNKIINKFNASSIIFRSILYVIELIIFWFVFPPFYYKIDDVFMLMISGGFGNTFEKSPLIYHSNIIIGYLSNYLPPLFDIQPYNIINIFFIITIFFMINEFLYKIIEKFLLTLLITGSILFFFITRPTFTTISGTLFCVGVLGLLNYLKYQNSFYIFVGFGFFILSTLVRDEQSVFMTLLILPIIYKIFKINSKLLIKISLISIVAISIFQVINRLPYSENEFDNLGRFASAQYQLTDYGADIHLAEYPNILENNNLTKNDLHLIRNWYFYDTNLVNISKLEKILKESNWNNYLQVFDFKTQSMNFFDILKNYPNLFLYLFLIFLFFSIKNKNIQFYYIISIFIYIAFGFFVGRQLNYILYPINLALIFILIFFFKMENKRKIIIYVISLANLIVGVVNNFNNKENIRVATNELLSINSFKVWQIGGGWSLPHVYPLFDKTSWKKKFSLFLQTGQFILLNQIIKSLLKKINL